MRVTCVISNTYVYSSVKDLHLSIKELTCRERIRGQGQSSFGRYMNLNIQGGGKGPGVWEIVSCVKRGIFVRRWVFSGEISSAYASTSKPAFTGYRLSTLTTTTKCFRSVLVAWAVDSRCRNSPELRLEKGGTRSAYAYNDCQIF